MTDPTTGRPSPDDPSDPAVQPTIPLPDAAGWRVAPGRSSNPGGAPNPFAPPGYVSASSPVGVPPTLVPPPPPPTIPPPGPVPFPTAEPEPSLSPAPRRGLGAGAVIAVVAIALVAGAGGGVGAQQLLDDTPAPQVPTTMGGSPAPRPEGSVAEIAATALPSVVSLQVAGAEGVATGSGFVLRADGYILTNNHVVAGAAGGGDIVVLFSDGHESSAELVGRTKDYDLAVVKVEDKDLIPLPLGDSDQVVVGDPVVAVGAPLGLNGTVTTGIVSALHRPVQAGDGGGDQEGAAYIDAIQTDAAINPGNSGGPLVNAAGEVIGINSAIATPPGAAGAATGSIGLGFAIPSNQAKRTAEQLIANGVATYPVIGVLLDQRYQGEGVRVVQSAQGGTDPVTAEGPADRAGIKPGDVILAIDGRPVTASDELIVAIRAKAPGDTVTLRVRSGSGERDVDVVLDEAQSE